MNRETSDFSPGSRHIFPYAKAICFIRGRLKFSGEKNPATFPSAIIVFSPHNLTTEQVEELQKWGFVLMNNYTKLMYNPCVAKEEEKNE